ncbi:hypothetical protein [Acetomicrobium sp. S15 = DSM 107314]|jgi:hypothetical protein|uniref:hypothetical protein n=1 Tax=Acetomicrobium sp. S15 = DSM 107314 TaxID=2529858 RepID=UPI0018E0CD44|nr:hypothetical protein [Acetomicrobium sp. S15 = DSM 107314]
MITREEFAKIWDEPIVKLGTITLIVAVVFSFPPSLYLYFKYGVFPPLPLALKAWGMIATIFGAFYIVEPISYYPILGLSGTYMSFLAGNISNLRLPCSAMAQEVVGVEPATPEAEIISTLGIAGSIIINVIFLTVGAIAGFALLRLFPQAVADALKNYAAAAIFGAVYGQFSLRYPKVAIIALPIPLIVIGLLKFPAWSAIAISVFGTIGISRWLYVSKKL